MPEHYDLAIVGAGIVGATAAFIAHRRNAAARILLIDRTEIGQGASAYSAGLEIPFGRTPRQKEMAIESAAFYSDLLRQNPHLPIREISSYLTVAEGALPGVHRRFAAATQAGTQDWDRVQNAFPDFHPATGECVIPGPGSRVAHVADLCRTLVHELQLTAMLDVQANSNVEHIDGTTLHMADGSRRKAARILSATGPWFGPSECDSFLRQSGVRIKKVVALHIASAPPANAPLLFFPADDAFILPLENQWLLSIASTEWDCHPDAAQLRISPAEQQLGQEILNRRVPSFVSRLNGGRVFCDAYSQDWAPLIENLPTAPNVVVASGASGAGFRLAPAIANRALNLLGWPSQEMAGDNHGQYSDLLSTADAQR